MSRSRHEELLARLETGASEELSGREFSRRGTKHVAAGGLEVLRTKIRRAPNFDTLLPFG